MRNPPNMDDEDSILAGEYALGLLTPDQSAAFETRLEREPKLRVIYEAWVENFANLSDVLPDSNRPHQVYEKIEAQLFPDNRPKSRIRLGVAPAAIIMVCIVTGLYYWQKSQTGIDPSAPAQSSATQGVLSAEFDAQQAQLWLVYRGNSAPDGYFYQVWLTPLDGDWAGEMIPLGALSDGAQTPKGRNFALPAQIASSFGTATLTLSQEPQGRAVQGNAVGPVQAAIAMTRP